MRCNRGIIHANIGDISHYLNAGTVPGSPLTEHLDHRERKPDIPARHRFTSCIFRFPSDWMGQFPPSPDGRIHLHVDRLSVLKLPVKGLLGDFHVSIADLMGKTSVAGVEASQNDIYFDTQKLLPAPHIHGQLTSVRRCEPGY